MQEVFDYFIAQLNDNTDSLLYDGNYVFKFNQDKLTVLSAVTGTLVNEELDYTPVSILTKQPIPFVENNKRIDWLVEFGLLVRIDGAEYDTTTDLDYANIASVMTALQGTIYEPTSGVRYVFKTQEPTYNGYTFLGKSKVAIISCVFNVTQITFGYFGQDSTITLGTKSIDWTSCSITSTRRFYTAGKIDDSTNDFNKEIGRSMVFELTFNYKDELDFLQEVYGKKTLSTQYALSHTFNSVAYTYTVVVESGVESLTKGGVKQLTLRLVEV